MKKSILLIVVILFLPLKVYAASMDSYIDWTLDRTVFAHQWRNGEDHITNLAWITANGETAYCIEPGIMGDKASYYSSTTNIYDTNLGGVNTNRLSLIGYYGYGYGNHNTREYYMATQELIWRFMGVDDVWWTDQKTGGNTFNIENEKNEIMRLVNNYEKAPSFSMKNEYIVSDNISLNDNNNILNEYEIESGNVNISGNKINLDIRYGNNNFTLRRKENGYSPTYFYKDGYQTIGSFKFAYSYKKTYTIKGVYGKIVVEKYDNDTKSKTPISETASLEGAEYTLYINENAKIASMKTNQDGMITFYNLPKGTYYIQETSPSPGYTTSNELHKIVLDSNNIVGNVNSYENIIKNKIVIIKVLDDSNENICTPEEGIWFSVYDLNDNFIKKGITDKNGNLTLELNYGEYILKQDNAPNGIDRVDDIKIKVEENNVIQNLALVNHPIKKMKYEVISTNPKVEYLPNTGKNNIFYLVLFIFISMIYMIYDKRIA